MIIDIVLYKAAFTKKYVRDGALNFIPRCLKDKNIEQRANKTEFCYWKEGRRIIRVLIN